VGHGLFEHTRILHLADGVGHHLVFVVARDHCLIPRYLGHSPPDAHRLIPDLVDFEHGLVEPLRKHIGAPYAHEFNIVVKFRS